MCAPRSNPGPSPLPPVSRRGFGALLFPRRLGCLSLSFILGFLLANPLAVHQPGISSATAQQPEAQTECKPSEKERVESIFGDLISGVLQRNLPNYTVTPVTYGKESLYEISFGPHRFAFASMTKAGSLLFRIDENGDGLCERAYDSDADREMLKSRLVPEWIRTLQRNGADGAGPK